MLEHVAHDRLRLDPVAPDPRVVPGEDLERRLEEVGFGLGPGDLFELLHTLLVLDAVALELGDQGLLGLVELGEQNDHRVVEHGLDDTQQLPGEVGCLPVESVDRFEREQRQWLVEPKIILQVEIDTNRTTLLVGFIERLEDLGFDQRAVDGDRAADVAALVLAGLVVVDEQVAHRRTAVAGPIEHVEHHGVAHRKAAVQCLRSALAEPSKGVAVPVGIAPLRRLTFDQLLFLLGIGSGLGLGLLVLDHVFGGLHDHRAGGVETAATGPTGDLLELPHRQHSDPTAVVLAELGEEHRANRDVDTHAERVGATDQLEQALLGELLNEQPVLGEEPGMVHPDAGEHEALEVLADGRVESEPTDGGFHRLLFVLGEHVEAGETLGPRARLLLGEVHDVDGLLAVVEQVADRFKECGFAVLEIERHGPFGARDEHSSASRPPAQVLLELGGVAEGGRHQQEVRTTKFEQGHLPGPPSITVAVVVKLVHHDEVDIGVVALAQGSVGEDLGGADDHGGIAVDGGVAGDHADVVGPERCDHLEELLAHQRLDGRRVDRTLSLGDHRERTGKRDHRLPGSGRRGEHDIVATEDRDDRFLLVWIELETATLRPFEKGEQQGVGGGVVGDVIEQRRLR